MKTAAVILLTWLTVFSGAMFMGMGGKPVSNCPDTCVVCGMKLNNESDREFQLVVGCFEDNATRGRLIKEVKKLKKIKQ